MLSTKKSWQTSFPKDDSALRCTAMTRALASKCKIPSVYRHGRATRVVHLSALSHSAGISGKPGSMAHSPYSDSWNSGSTIVGVHFPLRCSKPAASSAWTRALPPGSLLNLLRSVVRPQPATTSRGQIAVETPKPVSLASLAVTYGHH